MSARAQKTSFIPVLIIGTPQTIGACARQMARSSLPDHRVIGAATLQPQNTLPDWTPDIPLLGSLGDLRAIHRAQPFDVALVSIPAVMTGPMLKVQSALEELGVAMRRMPTVEDVMIHGDSGAGRSRSLPVDPTLLIGRPARRLDMSLAHRLIEGQSVLITGAGGSIGSELARICAACRPGRLVLMERSENALFEIDRQLATQRPELSRRAILHDVVEARGTMRHLMEERPDVVFHAAAHKHVPMMEDHPAAAVNNNVFGTRAVADAAVAAGTRRFVMISSDKAVNPTSVMGATKRLAEIYVRHLNGIEGGRTHFRVVRFGNVLGSACSVLPIWLTQLADGGPITVTDPRMTRYFMTIPEAASLVIQAAALNDDDAPGASVFELDMGEAIPILDIALRLVRLCGLRPVLDLSGVPDLPEETRRLLQGPSDGTTVPIRVTGIRPGEKLHEELAYQVEQLQPTGCQGVLAWAGPEPESPLVQSMIGDLKTIRDEYSKTAVVSALIRHVPELGSVTSPISSGGVQAA